METLDKRILQCLIEKAVIIAEQKSWKDKFIAKTMIDKLMKEWQNLAEKFPSVINNVQSAELRENAHLALHYAEMHGSAKNIQPYYPCLICFRRNKS